MGRLDFVRNGNGNGANFDDWNGNGNLTIPTTDEIILYLQIFQGFFALYLFDMDITIVQTKRTKQNIN